MEVHKPCPVTEGGDHHVMLWNPAAQEPEHVRNDPSTFLCGRRLHETATVLLTQFTFFQNQVFFFFFAKCQFDLSLFFFSELKTFKNKCTQKLVHFPNLFESKTLKEKTCISWKTPSLLSGVIDKEVTLSLGLGWVFPAILDKASILMWPLRLCEINTSKIF